MRKFLVAAAFFLAMDNSPAETNDIVLWPNGAPGALGTAAKDIPTLTPYYPVKKAATGTAMLVCPGGGYGLLSPRSGKQFAEWFASNGITAFVLNYRLGGTNGYHWPAQFDDATRAMRLLRYRAKEFDIDTNRIGIVGGSAGGHLAAMVLVRPDAGKPDAADPIERESSRPNLGILCYPVITFSGSEAHVGTRQNALGKDFPPELARELSPELHVTRKTPPCFVWTTGEDDVVPIENSLNFLKALRTNGVPFAFHIYEKGPHGLGIHVVKMDPTTPLHPWTTDCLFWLKERGFVR